MNTRLISLRLTEETVAEAQRVALKEDRKRAQILARWVERGREEERMGSGVDKLRSKKNREVAPLVGAEGVGGTPQPSAVGVSGLSGKPVNLTPYSPSIEPTASFAYGRPTSEIPPGSEVTISRQAHEIYQSADFPNKIESKSDVKAAVAKMSSARKLKSCAECGAVNGMHMRGCGKAK